MYEIFFALFAKTKPKFKIRLNQSVPQKFQPYNK